MESGAQVSVKISDIEHDVTAKLKEALRSEVTVLKVLKVNGDVITLASEAQLLSSAPTIHYSRLDEFERVQHDVASLGATFGPLKAGHFGGDVQRGDLKEAAPKLNGVSLRKTESA